MSPTSINLRQIWCKFVHASSVEPGEIQRYLYLYIKTAILLNDSNDSNDARSLNGVPFIDGVRKTNINVQLFYVAKPQISSETGKCLMVGVLPENPVNCHHCPIKVVHRSTYICRGIHRGQTVLRNEWLRCQFHELLQLASTADEWWETRMSGVVDHQGQVVWPLRAKEEEEEEEEFICHQRIKNT